MKTRFKLLGMAFFTLLQVAFAGDPVALGQSNYVVIGAFSKETNAIKFTSRANKGQVHADFALNSSRQLYYVFVLETDDREKAIEEATRLRSETSYWDTWVYSGALGIEFATASTDIDPITDSAIDRVKILDQPQLASAGTAAPTTREDDSQQLVANTTSNQAIEKAQIDEGMATRAVRFEITSAAKGTILPGSVDMLDIDKSKKVASYKGNEIVNIPMEPDGNVAWVCDLFGYRKQQRAVDFVNDAELAKGDAGEVVVPFQLVRLRKGDIAVMYNVYFYKDAAIMRPESQYEVNSLLEMLQENPKYKIKIHGHTNGNATGKIIQRGPDAPSYFSLTGSRDGFGSAKKLSQSRAEVIKEYLMYKGVAEDRLVVRAWGGKRPIYDKNHSQAAANVRVEIEIIEE